MSFWIAGAALAGGIGGAVIGSGGARSAAKTQAAASDRASEIYRQNFQDTQKTLQPYINVGPSAIDRQQAILGLKGATAQQQARDAAFSGPGFDYMRDRVIGDVNRTASSTGMLRSGNRLAALTERLQGLYAAQEQNYFNQLGAMTGVGLSGASALAGVGQSAAAGQANATMQGGAASAQGILGASQAYSSAFGDLAGGIGYLGRSGAFGGGSGGGLGGYQGAINSRIPYTA